MSVEAIVRQYNFNLAYAKTLVQDIPEEQMTFVPSNGLVNHPAFTLGHLVSGSAMLAEDLGAAFEMPAGWAGLFLRKGPGDLCLPDPDTSKYPVKQALLGELEAQHNKVKQLLLSLDHEKLGRPVAWRFATYMPGLLDVVVFMCINHEAMHLGQLAAWRRAMDLPSALAVL